VLEVQALVAIVFIQALIAMKEVLPIFYHMVTNTVALEEQLQAMVCMKSLKLIFWLIAVEPSSLMLSARVPRRIIQASWTTAAVTLRMVSSIQMHS